MPNDIEVGYRQLLKEQQTKASDDFMNSADPYAVSTEAAPTKPSPAEQPVGKPSFMQGLTDFSAEKAGVKAAGETLVTGYQHFVNGLNQRLSGQSVLGNVSESASAAGEMILGGMTVLWALPAGIGAAIHEAVRKFTPGLNDTVALPSMPSAMLKASMGLIGMGLDPESRRLLFTADTSKMSKEDIDKRQAMVDEIYKPMTYGELIDNVASIGSSGLLGTVLSRVAGLKGKGAVSENIPRPEPLKVQDAASATPKRLWKEPTSPTEYPSKPWMTSEEMAARLGQVAEDLHGKVEGKSAVAPAKAPEQAPTASVAEPPPPDASYTTHLKSAIEIATQKAEEMLTEEAKSNPELASLTPKETTAKVDKRRGKPVSNEPLTDAETKFLTEDQGMSPEDISTMQPREARRVLIDAKMKARQPLGELAGEAEAEVQRQLKLGESGKVDIPLIARMAVGAAIGGTQGDTPEERIAYMLGGMALGGFAPRLISIFRKDPAIAPILDETNPKMPGASPPQDILSPVQRVIKTNTPPESMDAINRILRSDPDVPLTRDDLRQGHITEMKTWGRLKNMADRMIDDGESFPDGELKNTLAFARTLHDNIKATGQRIGATGAKGVEGVRVKMAQINQLAKEWNPASGEHELALAIKASGGIENIGTFTRLNYAIAESILQAWYGSVLTGKAMVKVPIGTAPMMPIALWDRSLASLKFWDDQRPPLNEVSRGAVAMFEGTLDQLKMLKNWRTAWQTLGDQAKDLGASPLDMNPRGFEALAGIAEDTGHEGLAKAFDWMNSAANLGPGSVARVHGMFKAINGRMATTWEAMEQAGREGLSGDEYKQRVRHLVNHYDELDPDALVRIKQFRDHQTFTQPFQSKLMQAIQSGPENPWFNLAYRIGVLPFARIGVRLAEIGAEYTPGLNLASANFRRQIAAGGTEASTATARLATGSAVIGSFVYLGAQGLVTGSLPKYPGSVTMEQAGRPANSFWDPISSKWRSHAGMEPMSEWISTGADLAYLLGQMDEPTAEKVMTAASVAISANVGQNRFMQPISNIVSAISEGNTDKQWEKTLDLIRKDLSGFMPAGLREVTSGLEDGEQKRVMASGKYDKPGVGNMMHQEFRQLLDGYMKDLGMSTGEPGAPPFIKTKRNMFTGDLLTNDSWPFNPYTAKPAQSAPWATEIRRLDGADLKPLPDFIGKNQQPNIGLTDKLESPGVRLLPQELDRWEILMTQEVKDGNGHLVDSLNHMVQSPLYNRQNDNMKKELLHKVMIEFRTKAETRLLKEFPELDKELKMNMGTAGIDRYVETAKQPAARLKLQQKYGPGVAP